MGLSKSTRILILLAIDTAFFLLELTVGYAVHSLALVADSFHMLNDVLSLLVGLWAVKVANQRTNSKEYTYGWQRAETLGALINGVFLVALCLSIFLEAIQRLVEPQDVSHPKLVVIVGSFGLASNIIGLFLFHDHGHSHGGHSHGHDEVSAAEEGHVHGVDAEDHAVADEGGNVADVLPQSRIANLPSAAPNGKSSNRTPRKSAAGKRIVKRHRRSRSRNYSTIDDVPFYPPSFRSHIIDQPRQHADDSGSDGDADAVATEDSVAEASPLLRRERGSGSQISSKKREAAEAENNVSETTPLLSQSKDSGSGSQTSPKKRDCHADHKHQQPKEESKGSKGHGHSHDLNMRGVFLHVMGDALGNIGVIGSGLFIWLTNYTWRFYADPVISLIITVIILASAIPLCTAASRILLQAVPEDLSIDDIIDDITELDGIVSCHHLHVWQLSGTKLVASLHVQVDFDFKGEGSARYMDLAYQIKQCLHAYGIHSSTIQPEFCLDENHDHSGHTDESSSDEARAPKSGRNSGKASKTASVKGDEACLLTCSDACGNNKQCCDPGIKGCQGGK